MKNRHTSEAEAHPSSGLSDGLAPGRKTRVSPLQWKGAANQNHRLAPLPKELQVVAEIGQRVTSIVKADNPGTEYVQLAGHLAYVEGDRKENDFEVKTPHQTIAPGQHAEVVVTFAPKEER